MYSTEDNQGVVIDLGSLNYRIGYAGECLPKYVFDSCLGVAKLNEKYTDLCVFPLKPEEKRDQVDVAFPFLYDISSFIGTSWSTMHTSNCGNSQTEDCNDNGRGQVCNENKLKDGNLGVMMQWDVIEKLLEEGFGSRCLNESTNQRPVILTEPNFHSRSYRERACEALFEGLQVPSVALCKKAALTAYGCGRTSCYVLDAGGMTISVCALREGFVLQKTIQEYPVGSSLLNALGLSLFRNRQDKIDFNYTKSKQDCSKNVSTHLDDTYPDFIPLANTNEIHPPFAVIPTYTSNTKRPSILPIPHVCRSYIEWSLLKTAEAYKEYYCTKQGAIVDDTDCSKSDTYVLPDGTTVRPDIYDDFYPEILFNPSELVKNHKNLNVELQDNIVVPIISSCSPSPIGVRSHAFKSTLYISSSPLCISFSNATTMPTQVSADLYTLLSNFPGIPNMIQKCIDISANTISKDISLNLVVTGGCSLFPNFIKYLDNELNGPGKKSRSNSCNSSCNQRQSSNIKNSYLGSFDNEATNATSNDSRSNSELREEKCSADDTYATQFYGNLRILTPNVCKERFNCTWIGGSIIGSLGSFNKFLLNKHEYHEYGTQIIHKKFP